MLIAIAVLLGIVGFAVGFSAFAALARARLFRFVFRAVLSLLLLFAGTVFAVFSLGTLGMQALTKEETAARIKVVPSGLQRYDATVTFADGRVETYDLVGDDIYVDGHIVKWTPLANMMGLHTSYRLDRIAGRYRSVEQENTARRTVYAIGRPAMIDLVALGRRLPLADFFDAEYGSASYVPVAEPGELELKVSTTGLLLRPLPARSATERP
ncbi:MAG: hypothetical protein M3Z15_12300 [Pseudomonadota bacterium]|nr:hypothetical protein [Pseudomonadota bacterium]